MKIEYGTNGKVTIPQGYRVLTQKDTVQQGDLFKSLSSNEWEETKSMGKKINPFSITIYIRKN